MGTETIQVVYEPLGQEPITGTTYYHETLLYTNAAGERQIVTSFATGIGLSDDPIAMLPSIVPAALGEETDFGDLSTWSGSPSSPEAQKLWPNIDGSKGEDGALLASTNPVVTVASGDDLSAQWLKVTQAAQEIANQKYDYSPLTLNSNSAANTALTAAGILPPQEVGVEGPYWAPAAENILPISLIQPVPENSVAASSPIEVAIATPSTTETSTTPVAHVEDALSAAFQTGAADVDATTTTSTQATQDLAAYNAIDDQGNRPVLPTLDVSQVDNSAPQSPQISEAATDHSNDAIVTSVVNPVEQAVAPAGSSETDFGTSAESPVPDANAAASDASTDTSASNSTTDATNASNPAFVLTHVDAIFIEWWKPVASADSSDSSVFGATDGTESNSSNSDQATGSSAAGDSSEPSAQAVQPTQSTQSTLNGCELTIYAFSEDAASPQTSVDIGQMLHDIALNLYNFRPDTVILPSKEAATNTNGVVTLYSGYNNYSNPLWCGAELSTNQDVAGIDGVDVPFNSGVPVENSALGRPQLVQGLDPALGGNISVNGLVGHLALCGAPAPEQSIVALQSYPIMP